MKITKGYKEWRSEGQKKGYWDLALIKITSDENVYPKYPNLVCDSCGIRAYFRTFVDESFLQKDKYKIVKDVCNNLCGVCKKTHETRPVQAYGYPTFIEKDFVK